MLRARWWLAAVAALFVCAEGAIADSPTQSSSLCRFAAEQRTAFVSCESKAAFAKEFSSWEWRQAVRAAINYGLFDWREAAEAYQYDPKVTPRLLVELGASPESTSLQREVGKTFALRLLSCGWVSLALSRRFGDGSEDALYENALFGWPAGVYLVQSLKMTAREVRDGLMASEGWLDDMARFANEGNDSDGAQAADTVLRRVCSSDVTHKSDVIVMILADRYGLRRH